MYSLKNTLAFALCVGLATPVMPQGFEDGSFEGGNFDNGGNVSNEPPSPPPPPISNLGTGFDQGSFETEGGTANVDQTIAPPPPPPPHNDNIAEDVTPPPPPPPVTTPEPPIDNSDGNDPPNNYQLDPQIAAFETNDLGVPSQSTLRQGQFHGPTPTSVPGAQLVTTQVLFENLNQGVQIILIDVLGGQYSLPNAYSATALASSGSFQDHTQQQANTWLNQITNGQKDMPIVLFCSDPLCWLSYNATLRTVAAGYTNVYWYRGGLQAWQMAGLQMTPIGF
ncbi:MAG: rhodanese-like domain-containing protein [Paracoccaceae bacterium]